MTQAAKNKFFKKSKTTVRAAIFNKFPPFSKIETFFLPFLQEQMAYVEWARNTCIATRDLNNKERVHAEGSIFVIASFPFWLPRIWVLYLQLH